MRRFEDEEEERRPLSPPKHVKPRRTTGFGTGMYEGRAMVGDVEMLHPIDVQLRAPQAGAKAKPKELGRGRVASKGTARMQLERARMTRDAEHLAKQKEIAIMSKPRTKEQKV